MRIDGVMIGRQEQDRDRMASEEPFRTEPFDLVLPQGEGPLWGLASEDLNVTLLCWGAGQGGPEHVNAERDVLIVVIDGAGRAVVDGAELELRANHALMIARGSRRRIEAGSPGLRYLSIHLRRPPLGIEPLVRRSAASA